MKQLAITICCAAALLSGCRGGESAEPPVHLNLNMDIQERYDPQELNPFFADRRAMRPLVPGTVARGMLQDEPAFFDGRTGTGDFVEEIPIPVTREVLARGQERYHIFCAPCHGDAGDGQGIITTGGFGYTPAPTYHSEMLRDVPDGYLYSVIENGIRTMPAYGPQIPVADRWAIVAYIRALQLSQYAPPEAVPPGMLQDLQAQAPPASPAAGQAAADDTTATP